MNPLCAALLLVTGSPASAGDNTKDTGVREAMQGWIRAALAGKVEDAAALAVPGTKPAAENGMKEFRKLVAVATLEVPTVWASAKHGRAAAISDPVRLIKADPDGRDTGVLSFQLVQVKDRWLLMDIDFGTEEKARRKLKRFKEMHPDAREIPARPKD